VYSSLLKIIRGPTFGATIVKITTTTQLIKEQLPHLKSRKRKSKYSVPRTVEQQLQQLRKEIVRLMEIGVL
jgi:hypothetical protein